MSEETQTLSANPKEWNLIQIRKNYPTFTRHIFKASDKGKIAALRRAVAAGYEAKVEDFKKAVVNGHIEIDISVLGNADKKLLQGVGFDVSEE